MTLSAKKVPGPSINVCVQVASDASLVTLKMSVYARKIKVSKIKFHLEKPNDKKDRGIKILINRVFVCCLKWWFYFSLITC